MAETESEGIGDIHNYLQHFNPKDVGGVVISKTEVIGEKRKKWYGAVCYRSGLDLNFVRFVDLDLP